MNKNPYFIEDSSNLTSKQLVYAKQNNYYIFKALNFIYGSVVANETKVGGLYRAALLTGELRNSDSATGLNSNGLGEKLKFLTMALSDPKKAEQFKNSYLFKEVLTPLFSGSLADPSQEWRTYKRSNNCDKLFKNKGCLESALVCQRDDMNSPIGIDFSKVIDSFVKTDEKGNFYLNDSYTDKEEASMAEAVNKELKTLKGNKRFKDNFKNPNEPENDNEDELDNF